MRLNLNKEQALLIKEEDITDDIQEVFIRNFGQDLVMIRRGYWDLRIIYSEKTYSNHSSGTLEEILKTVKVLLV